MMDFPIGVNVSVTNLSTEVPAGIRMFIDGEEITTEDAPMRQAARTGEPHYNFEYEALFPDGRRKTVLASVVPMLDTGGTVRKVIGVYTDITERKHAETALRESEQRLRLAQQAARVGAFEWNLQNDRNVWTPELEALYGLQPGEFAQTGTAWAELIHPEDRANMTQLAQQSSHTGELTTGEWRVVWPDGSVHWLAGRWQVFKDASGQPLKMTGVNVDITDLKQAEEALRKANESLEQKVQERTMDLQILTAQLEKSRHELRKLASELVISEERERKRVAGVLHDDIAQTLAAARMRLDLLLSIASDQKDKQTLQEVKTFLVQSIRETRALMNDLGNPLLFDLGVKSACESLAKRLMEGHPTRIICDIRDEYKHLDPDMKAMLFQVVRELLNNVVKHSQAENAHVLVDTENGQFRVKVTDDGVGFDSKMLGVPSGEGGFGLYSVRERLTAMDGSLDIESTPGAGTAVTATLPAALD
jgi:PAS domain S-box-containing protein